mmetsp:Transcript_19395/g.40465  ORF Transcript_19395/g.40465 Transcript_19395/m.40465 type:complete len:336 (-) Transcript_19395:313-1320(-)
MVCLWLVCVFIACVSLTSGLIVNVKPSHLVHTKNDSKQRSAPSSLIQTFVPSFPLQPRYGEFVFYNQVQNLATTLRNTLSTLFILDAFEKTSSQALALTATLSFLARDGAGMVSTLCFSRYAQPFSLSTDVKRWRYAADITCNVALGLEFITSYVLNMPQNALVLSLCLANCLKSICGMMAGAASGPIDFYFAGRDSSNLPELNSKSQAQHTLSNGVGIIAGALLSRTVSGLSKTRSRVILYVGYTILTLCHLIANARLLRTVAFNTINSERLRIIISGYKQLGRIKTPDEVAAEESLLFRPGFGFRCRKLRVGVACDGDEVLVENEGVIVKENR